MLETEKLYKKHLPQLWFQISSHGMHSKEAIKTMDMPRRCCISFEQMQDNICILFPLILIPMEDFFYGKRERLACDCREYGTQK